jgi:ATP-binding cassette subfamily G (WHITE) protein 2 (SNQ2)
MKAPFEESELTLTGGNGPFDLEKTLRQIVKGASLDHLVSLGNFPYYDYDRRNEANHKVRELGVMFKDLKVVGLGASASYQPTPASILNHLNLIKAVNAIRYPPTKDILTGFEGVVRTGEMLCRYTFRFMLSFC